VPTDTTPDEPAAPDAPSVPSHEGRVRSVEEYTAEGAWVDPNESTDERLIVCDCHGWGFEAFDVFETHIRAGPGDLEAAIEEATIVSTVGRYFSSWPDPFHVVTHMVREQGGENSETAPEVAVAPDAEPVDAAQYVVPIPGRGFTENAAHRGVYAKGAVQQVEGVERRECPYCDGSGYQRAFQRKWLEGWDTAEARFRRTDLQPAAEWEPTPDSPDSPDSSDEPGPRSLGDGLGL
jgi:hypothetical protein